MNFVDGGTVTLDNPKTVNIPVSGPSYVCYVGGKIRIASLSGATFTLYDVAYDGSLTTGSQSATVNTPIGNATAVSYWADDNHIIMACANANNSGSAPVFNYDYTVGFSIDGVYVAAGSGSGTYSTVFSESTGFVFSGVSSGSRLAINADDVITYYVAFANGVNVSTLGNYDPANAGGFGYAINGTQFMAPGGICDNATLAEVDTLVFTGNEGAIESTTVTDSVGAIECLTIPGYVPFTVLLDFVALKSYTISSGVLVPFDRTWGLLFATDGTKQVVDIHFPTAPTAVPRAVYPYHLLVPLPLGCIPLCEDNP